MKNQRRGRGAAGGYLKHEKSMLHKHPLDSGILTNCHRALIIVTLMGMAKIIMRFELALIAGK